jgi:hypothetical protein
VLVHIAWLLGGAGGAAFVARRALARVTVQSWVMAELSAIACALITLIVLGAESSC